MAQRDRLGNILAIGAALIAWLGVALVVTTTYPQDQVLAGAAAIVDPAVLADFLHLTAVVVEVRRLIAVGADLA